jgi:hypothetical protein
VKELPANPVHYTLPLLPRHRSVLVYDGKHADGERFGRLFRQTWARLPLKIRRRLLKHWRSVTPKIVQNRANPMLSDLLQRIVWPSVELADWKSDLFRGNSRAAWGQCQMRGTRFNFWSIGVNHLLDEGVCFLIAHELAHASMGVMDPEHSTSPSREEDADDVARCWGFDPMAFYDSSVPEWVERGPRWSGRYPKSKQRT